MMERERFEDFFRGYVAGATSASASPEGLTGPRLVVQLLWASRLLVVGPVLSELGKGEVAER